VFPDLYKYAHVQECHDQEGEAKIDKMDPPHVQLAVKVTPLEGGVVADNQKVREGIQEKFH